MVGRRVRASRALAWLFFRDGSAMFCAHAFWRGHWSRPWLDAVFFVVYLGQRNHCAGNAAWEARQDREPGLIDDWRRSGLL